MTTPHKSIFNLIEIFRQTPKRIMSTVVSDSHCEHKYIHDYYCDAKRPHNSNKYLQREKLTSTREKQTFQNPYDGRNFAPTKKSNK